MQAPSFSARSGSNGRSDDNWSALRVVFEAGECARVETYLLDLRQSNPERYKSNPCTRPSEEGTLVCQMVPRSAARVEHVRFNR